MHFAGFDVELIYKNASEHNISGNKRSLSKLSVIALDSK